MGSQFHPNSCEMYVAKVPNDYFPKYTKPSSSFAIAVLTLNDVIGFDGMVQSTEKK